MLGRIIRWLFGPDVMKVEVTVHVEQVTVKLDQIQTSRSTQDRSESNINETRPTRLTDDAVLNRLSERLDERSSKSKIKAVPEVQFGHEIS